MSPLQISPELSAAIAAGCFVLSAALILVFGKSAARSTLRTAHFWAVGCLLICGIVEYYGGAAASQPLRFTAAIGLYCPLVSVLGAKRPQHSAWNWIVLSLWCVMVLPAAESLFIRPGAGLQIHDARRWFLGILIFVGLCNYLPTRFAIGVCLWAASLMLLLSKHLPLGHLWSLPPHTATMIASVLILVAIILVLVLVRRTERSTDAGPDSETLNTVWQRFRNNYGAMWALRIAERVNAEVMADESAERPLKWNGLADEAASEGRRLKSLLANFIDTTNINARK